MARYIDADALVNAILTEHGCDPKYTASDDIDGIKAYADSLIMERLNEQPTIDAVPVVHGEWEIVPNDENTEDYYKMRCSVCGETLWSIQPEELYCCKCGAKMDGKEKEK